MYIVHEYEMESNWTNKTTYNSAVVLAFWILQVRKKKNDAFGYRNDVIVSKTGGRGIFGALLAQKIIAMFDHDASIFLT